MRVALDGNNIFFRSLYQALDSDKKLRKGFLVHIFLSSIVKWSEFGEVIITADSASHDYWRKDIFPEYKANRRAKRDQSLPWDEIFELYRKILHMANTSLGVITLRMDKMEADDIMYALALQAQAEGLIMVSSDRDLHQLLRYKGARLFHPDGAEVFVEDVEHELEIKILTGDKGDNISNVRAGIGPKRAEKLLAVGIPEELKQARDRNRELIDLRKIPEVYVKRMVETIGVATSNVDLFGVYEFCDGYGLVKILQKVVSLAKRNASKEQVTNVSEMKSGRLPL